MDNIFEILIYLLIIVSFLSSLFKKKEKPDLKKGSPIPKPPSTPKSQTSQKDEYDILKEIEKMFKTEASYPEKEEDKNFHKEEKFESASEHLETTDWHKPTQTEHKPTVSEHSFEIWDDKVRKAEESKKEINEKIVQQAEKFEKNLKRKSLQKTNLKRTIRQKFRQPASLKEYVLISEILGKPRALSKGLFGDE